MTLKRVVSVFLFLLPFIVYPGAIDVSLVPKLLFFGVSLIIISLWLHKEIRRLFPIILYNNRVYPILLLYLIVAFISFKVGLNKKEVLFEFIKIVFFTSCAFVLTVLFIKEKDFIYSLKKTIQKSLLLLSAVSLVILFFGSSFQYFTEIGELTLLSSKNLLASGLLLMLPFALVDVKGKQFLAISSAILAITTIFLLGARAAIIALLCMTPFTLFFNKDTLKMIKNKSVYVGGSIVLLFATLVVLWQGWHHSMFQKLLSSNSIMERWQLWKNSIAIIEDSPLFGIGLGNWKIMFPKYGLGAMVREAQQGTIHYQRPHNDFIWVWTEMGLLGFLAYLGLFASTAFYAVKLIIRKVASSRLIKHLLLGIIGFFVVSCFSFPKERVFHLCFFALYVAIIGSEWHRNNKYKRIANASSHIITNVMVTGAIVTCVSIGFCRISSEVKTRKALAVEGKGQYPKANVMLYKANNYAFSMDYASTPLYFYSAINLFKINRLDEGMRDLEKAYLDHPYHIHILNNLGSCYQTKGNSLKAIEYYNRALKISPNFNDCLLNLGVVYFQMGDYQKAMQIWESFKPFIHEKNQKRLTLIEQAKQKQNVLK